MRWMNRVLVLATLLVAGGSHFSAADDRALGGRPPLALTCVANAGVLAAAGNTKILIDALLDRPDHVALTHLPIDREGDIPTKTEAVRQRYKDLLLLLPGMATRTFSGGALPARQ